MQWKEEDKPTLSEHEFSICTDLADDHQSWMITHYINISNSGVSELYLNVSLNTDILCCEDYVDVRVYQTNDLENETWTNPSEYFPDPIPLQLFVEAALVPKLANLVIPLDGTDTGLYLAFVVSSPGACITITRIVLFYMYFVCPEKIEALLKFPETIAPTAGSPEAVLVDPNCTSNATLTSTPGAQLECHALGVWQTNEASCACDRGYFFSAGSFSQTCQGDC